MFFLILGFLCGSFYICVGRFYGDDFLNFLTNIANSIRYGEKYGFYSNFSNKEPVKVGKLIDKLRKINLFLKDRGVITESEFEKIPVS